RSSRDEISARRGRVRWSRDRLSHRPERSILPKPSSERRERHPPSEPPFGSGRDDLRADPADLPGPRASAPVPIEPASRAGVLWRRPIRARRGARVRRLGMERFTLSSFYGRSLVLILGLTVFS